ncbi:MAG: hypothetical protein RBS16_01085 [Candidatus Cloacimonadales bacterium]|jgi:chemotaxis protein CheD|nr:hypothetical protein [Candidatus Cloacimonadota bacterium]MDX9976607.1 hypothetical protein [Candidatus Cloacimonadales bacterium]
MNNNLTTNKYLLKPGYMIINQEPTVVYGVVGSGVFLALWDEEESYSACCSYLYPFTKDKSKSNSLYGNTAIHWLIKKMKDNGSDTKNIKAHLLGGASSNSQRIGDNNILIAKKVLKKFNIEVVAADIGGKMGRKYIFDCQNGQSVTFKTHKIRKSDWYPYLSE